MPDKKYILKPGERAIVEINNRAGIRLPSRPAQSLLKGIIPVRRRKKYLARRLVKNFINFFDLGQIKVPGEDYFQDLEFRVLNFGYDDGDGFAPWTVAPLSVADFDAFRALLHEIPVENWKDHYAKFDYDFGHNYGLDLIDAEGNYFSPAKTGTRPRVTVGAMGDSVDGSKWLEKGLKIGAYAAPLTFLSFHGFNNFILANDENTKITIGNDFNNDEVEPPTLSGGENVFLTPFITSQVQHIYRANHPDGHDYDDIIFLGYSFLSRDIWLNYTPATLSRSIFTYDEIYFEAMTYDEQIGWYDYLKELPLPARHVLGRIETFVGNPEVQFRPMNEFPAFTDVNSNFQFHVDVNTDSQIVFEKAKNLPGTLLAVIEKRGVFYYVWQRTIQEEGQEKAVALYFPGGGDSGGGWTDME